MSEYAWIDPEAIGRGIIVNMARRAGIKYDDEKEHLPKERIHTMVFEVSNGIDSTYIESIKNYDYIYFVDCDIEKYPTYFGYHEIVFRVKYMVAMETTKQKEIRELKESINEMQKELSVITTRE